MREADAVFIALGTPSRRGDGHADLSYVYAATREIAAAVVGFTVVITKSTVPVGTGDEVERPIHETNPSADVAVASVVSFGVASALLSFGRAEQPVAEAATTGATAGLPVGSSPTGA